MLGILSISGDLHALSVAQQWEERTKQRCFLYQTDSTPESRLYDVEVGSRCQLTDVFGDLCDVGALRVIWNRRFLDYQPSLEVQRTKAVNELLRVEHASALLGSLDTYFTGRWINDPKRTRPSSNKIFQLEAARRVGFRVPKTLVSNNFESIERFSRGCGDQIIVKPLKGIRSPAMLPKRVHIDKEKYEDSLRIPAIYQEYIEGFRHLRVNVFGKRILAFRIDTDDFDWRLNLGGTKISQVHLDDEMTVRVQAFLDFCGFRMGVFDFKVSEAGKIFFLEVNPQGQFLFLEPFCEEGSILSIFVDFLIDEWRQQS